MENRDPEGRRYRSLVDALPDIVYERDLGGRITEINEAGLRFFGRKRVEMIGATFHDAADSHAYRSLEATNARLVAEGEDRSSVTLVSAAGDERVLESVTTLMRDADGRPSGARGVMRDVTQRIRLEEELRKQALELAASNDALRAADQMKARLASMLIHDLRTPVTVLTASVDLLSSRGEGAAFLDLARKACHEMERLIDEALDLYRPEGGVPPLLKEELAVTVLLEGPVSAASLVAAKHGVRVEVLIGPDLPAVDVDPARMRRAVGNLLSNAVRFSPAGSLVVVAARGVDEGQGVEISVEDQGPGIAADDLPRLFDPYYRARNAQGRGGTGLGLAIVKRIVDAHGGSVGVASAAARGSRFTLRLPAAPRARLRPEGPGE